MYHIEMKLLFFFGFVSIVQPILSLISSVFFFFLKNMSWKLQVNRIANKLFFFLPI